jgi:hypothetical protein
MALSWGTSGGTSIPRIILQVLSEDKTGKMKANEKMERPIPGNLCCS